MSALERAIAIAVEAHAGHPDKGGNPYILHPLRVMLALRTEEERMVGVLHDVCEDCAGWDFERLRSEGFSESAVVALASATKVEGESYEDFVLRAAGNTIGRNIKKADLIDNGDISRIAEPTKGDLERLARYARALELLHPPGQSSPPSTSSMKPLISRSNSAK